MSGLEDAKPQCGGGAGGAEEEYDLPLHIAALFMVLAASIFGCGFPVACKKISWLKLPDRVFFACKHFGTGVLVATAFVHLIPTAFDALTNPCLPDLFTDIYPAIPGLIMMVSMFTLFVIEMWLKAKVGGHSHGGPTGQMPARPPMPHSHSSSSSISKPQQPRHSDNEKADEDGYDFADVGLPIQKTLKEEEARLDNNFMRFNAVSDTPMPAWFVVFYEQYVRERMETVRMVNSARETLKTHHRNDSDAKTLVDVDLREVYDEENQDVSAQVLRKMNLDISLLEGGILFHSIFVGITISITTEGFIVLLVAILFHQMFEGVGLGSRIASVPYPKGSIRPWVLVVAFGTTAPIGQAIGLATRGSYDPDSAYGLILVGLFNAFSSGLLIYAALVDLLAEDFLSEEAQLVMTTKKKIEAFIYVLLGAVGMSIVGAFA